MALQNRWVRYVDRTYQQIKQRVLTELHSLVPEMTDHSESNPFVKLLSIYSGIAEMLGYYIDNTAREAHLPTARLYKNMVLHAKAYDYRIHSRLSSSVDVVFTLDGPAPVDFTIPLNTELEANGVIFYTTAPVTITTGNDTAIVSAKQFEPVAEAALTTADGSLMQVYEFPADLADRSSIIRVDGLAWTQQETLAYSLPTDQHYVQSVNEQGIPIVIFGDNFNGAAPENAAEITLQYLSTTGVNVDENSIDTINSVLLVPGGLQLAVTNPERSSGGSSEVETIEQLRRRIPKLIRTQERAVTGQNYIDVCELKAGVEKAGLQFSCGKTVDMYVVPTGGGIAASIFLTEVTTWMNLYRMVTTRVRVFGAGEIRIVYEIDVFVLPQYTNSVVAAAVQARMLAFMGPARQEIRGSVEVSDVYETVENTEGVDYSRIKKMTPRPYARPLNDDTPLLDWNREITQASTSVNRWRLAFTNATNFELYRNNNFIGNFTAQVQVSLPEIVFTVNVEYTANRIWEFFTYPFSGNIQLVEPSLPTALAEDIIINPAGGL